MKAIWTSCLEQFHSRCTPNYHRRAWKPGSFAGFTFRESGLALLTTLVLITMVACGGSSSSTAQPSPNNVGYSNASLSGSYVFSLSGVGQSGDVFAVLGVFTADGNGSITSGQEDVNDLFSGVLQQVAISGGTYSVGIDGRGQATLNFANGAPSATFNFVLLSTSKARVVELSNFELSSGVLEQQSTAPLGAPNGPYVLRMDGTNNIQFGQPVSRVGLLTATGTAASGAFDENYNGTFTPTIAVPSTTFSSFSAASGRGVLQFVTTQGGASSSGTVIDLVFYVVNSTRIEFLSVNQSEQLSGYADQQSGTFTTASVSNPYVYSISGTSATGFITETGSFTLNSGTVSNGIEDLVDTGTYSASVPFSGTYVADSTNNGRFTGAFTTSSRTVNFVLWFSSAQNAVLMTTGGTSPLVESGLVTVQPAVPTNSTVSGNYAFHLGGLTINAGSTVLEGQLLADGLGTFTGLEDFNQGGNVAIGVSAGGSYGVASFGRSTGSIGGLPVVLYAANSSTTYVMSTDGRRMLTGSLEAQH